MDTNTSRKVFVSAVAVVITILAVLALAWYMNGDKSDSGAVIAVPPAPAMNLEYEDQAELEWLSLGQYEQDLACVIWNETGKHDQQAFVEEMTSGANRMPLALAVAKIVIMQRDCV